MVENCNGIVDVNAKYITVRTARASGTIILSEKAFEVVKTRGCTKGDILAAATVAAIQAAKLTHPLLPLYHPLTIEAVDVDFKQD
jgi:cyclic pyranopterin phosphate synthase